MTDAPHRTATHDAGLLLLRLVLGVVFLAHGSQKLFGLFGGAETVGWGAGIEGFAGMLENMNVPEPLLAAWLTACSEFFGGLLVLIGLLTRLAAIPVLIVMIVAIVKVHSSAFFMSNNGMEFALTLAAIAAALVLTGPGRFSIDGAIWGGHRRRATTEDEHHEDAY